VGGLVFDPAGVRVALPVAETYFSGFAKNGSRISTDGNRYAATGLKCPHTSFNGKP
jgi:hypothetical protein